LHAKQARRIVNDEIVLVSSPKRNRHQIPGGHESREDSGLG
jgi:hypothetical protein